MTPINPTTFEKLRARYPQAVKKVFDAGVLKTASDFPSSNADNVFDTEDGLRVIISHDVFPEIYDVLHISISSFSHVPEDDKKSWSQLKTRQKHPTFIASNPTDLVRKIQTNLLRITGHRLPRPKYESKSTKGVIHMMWDWSDQYNLTGKEVSL